MDDLQYRKARRRALGGLCLTEIVSWGILYYTIPSALPTIVAQTGWSTSVIMTCYTVGLLVNASLAIPVGRLIDRHGPRWVMTGCSLLGAVALCLAAAAQTPFWFAAALVVGGFASAGLLYPPAFASITRWYGEDRIKPLTWVTLAGGLASTVFAPISASLSVAIGWRSTMVLLAVVLVVTTTPVHIVTLNLPWRAAVSTAKPGSRSHIRNTVGTRQFVFLAGGLAVTALGLYAITLNLVPLFVERGVAPTVAATILGLCGAGQLIGRLGFPRMSMRIRPTVRDSGVMFAAAISLIGLAFVPGALPLAIAGAMVAGAARGALTLVQATAVADRWGTSDIGTLNAIATTPTAFAIALGPATGAFVAQWLGGYFGACVLLAGLAAIGAVLATRTTVVPGKA